MCFYFVWLEAAERTGVVTPFRDIVTAKAIHAFTNNSAFAGAALENTEIGAPGAYSITVLVGKDTGDLVQVRHVVGGPCGQELGECDRAKGRVDSATIEVVGLEIQGAKFGEVRCTQGGKLVEETGKRRLRGAEVCLTVEGREGKSLAMFQDDLRAGEPIRLLPVDEMTDDLGDGPFAFALVAVCPCFGEVAEEGGQGRRGVGQEGDGFVEVLGHIEYFRFRLQGSSRTHSLRAWKRHYGP